MSEQIYYFFTSNKFYGPIIIIFLSIIIYTVITKILSKAVISGRSNLEVKRRKTLIKLFENIVKYSLLIVGLIIALNIYGVNTISIISGLGIIGIVVGLALQDTLKDIINGITIIMENYFVVGDIIKCNGFVGTVTDFGLKSTKITDAENKVYIISNRNIGEVINMSYKKTNIFLDVIISNEEKEKNIEKIFNDIIIYLVKENIVVEKESKYMGISKVDSSSSIYTIKLQCGPTAVELTKTTFYRQLKKYQENNKIKLV